jgi:lysine N6-hydroxylase
MSRTYDVVAIGLGPFNLGLAALTDPIDELDCVFLERADGFDWHPGMLLETSTLQVPFLADLVTLADPTSPLSFLNYAKQAGHLYSFYIREVFQPLRTEYNAYCQWAAAQLDTLRFGRDVVRVEHDEAEDVYVVHAATRGGRLRETYRGRHLVLGVGTVPHVPPGCRPLAGDALHSATYLDARERLLAKDGVTVVGSGQSAAEIVADLLDADGPELTWITRSPRFFPLDDTKLTLELTSPEYVDHFHALPPGVRAEKAAEHALLYKGIDAELIDEIFHTLYRRHRRGLPPGARLLPGTEVVAAEHDGDRFTLALRNTDTGARAAHETEGLVLATGYRQHVPAFLDPIRDRIAWDEHGRFDVDRGYAIDHQRERIFVQNAELHTHGFTAPDLGFGAYRNSCIIRALTGREVYPVERRIAMQELGVPAMAGAR